MSDAEKRKDLLRKYALGVEEIWKRLIDDGPDPGDPLALFDSAIQLTEKSLASLMAEGRED